MALLGPPGYYCPVRRLLLLGSILSTLIIAGASCSGSSGNGIALADFCSELAQAGCELAERCQVSPGGEPDCVARVTDLFDGCPATQHAVDLGEAEYSADQAQRTLDEYRQQACDTGVAPRIEGQGVFVGKLHEADICHSSMSCGVGLVCDGFNLQTGEGVCRVGVP